MHSHVSNSWQPFTDWKEGRPGLGLRDGMCTPPEWGMMNKVGTVLPQEEGDLGPISKYIEVREPFLFSFPIQG